MSLTRSASSPAIPFLPGNTLGSGGKKNNRRSQTLCYKLNTACDVFPGLAVGHDSLTTLAKSLSRTRSSPLLRETSEQRAERKLEERRERPAQLPAWLKHDKQCLRFYAYFQEEVVEHPTENFRVRNCVIFFYLEDGTMQVTEQKVENSGIWPQGPMLTRHKVPLRYGCTDEFFEPHHLCVGSTVVIYERAYRIIGCDEFTKWFYAQAGLPTGAEEAAPLDPFLQHQVWKTENVTVKTGFPRDVMEGKIFNELNLGGFKQNPQFKQFLENDRKVLRFYAYWDDPTRYGARNYFKVHYFLCDDSVEILNSYSRNSGRWQNPVFFTRSRLVLDPSFKISPGMVDESQERCLRPNDFRIGGTIPVFGRTFVIYEADESTRNFYKEYMGVDMTTQPVEPEEKVHFKLLPPPHTGLGTEEDSLGSVLQLRPKPPPMDMVKKMTMSDVVLRYEAKAENGVTEDAQRTFIIAIYGRDDEIAVFEAPVRNSGFWSGKFSAKGRKVNPDTGKRYAPGDFFVGARVTIASMPFYITRADEYALKWMEAKPEVYPQSSIGAIATTLQGLEAKGPPAQSALLPDDFRAAVASALSVQLTDQELVTVLRACGNDEAHIAMARVYEML